MLGGVASDGLQHDVAPFVRRGIHLLQQTLIQQGAKLGCHRTFLQGADRLDRLERAAAQKDTELLEYALFNRVQ